MEVDLRRAVPALLWWLVVLAVVVSGTIWG